MQFSNVSSHVEEYTLTGVLLKFPDNKERPCAPKKIYWVVYRIEIRERSIAVFQCLASRQRYLLDNNCYASLAPVFTQIQHGSVSRSHQLLRCIGTRLDPIKVGGAHFTLCRFLPCCAKTVHCSSLLSFTLNIGIKYK